MKINKINKKYSDIVNKSKTNKQIMSKNYRILLVDDESDIALAFRLALESNGFSVDVFTDPKEALSNFKSGIYKLALLDLKMPEIGGIELCEILRDIDEKIKVCFLTAFDIDYQVYECSNCLIKKPISIEDLIKRVEKEVLN